MLCVDGPVCGVGVDGIGDVCCDGSLLRDTFVGGVAADDCRYRPEGNRLLGEDAVSIMYVYVYVYSVRMQRLSRRDSGTNRQQTIDNASETRPAHHLQKHSVHIHQPRMNDLIR